MQGPEHSHRQTEQMSRWHRDEHRVLRSCVADLGQGSQIAEDVLVGDLDDARPPGATRGKRQQGSVVRRSLDLDASLALEQAVRSKRLEAAEPPCQLPIAAIDDRELDARVHRDL